jgi:Tfp pilus assembly protein PilF
MSAVEIYETILGFDHPETADAYTKMALAYQEQGSFSAASPWIRRAFTVFFKTFGPYDPITQSAYE